MASNGFGDSTDGEGPRKRRWKRERLNHISLSRFIAATGFGSQRGFKLYSCNEPILSIFAFRAFLLPTWYSLGLAHVVNLAPEAARWKMEIS